MRIADGGCCPHWPARLYLDGALRHKAVRRLIRPDKVPGAHPPGPIAFEGRDYILGETLDEEQLRAAFGDWYTSEAVLAFAARLIPPRG